MALYYSPMEPKRTLPPWKTGLLFGAISLILVAGFGLTPIETGDDWRIFYDTSRRIWVGAPLYQPPTGYYNAPWLAVLLAPLTLLPVRWGWAALTVANLLIALILARRWQTGLVQPILALLSPAMVYIALHGQVDALVLGGLLLPTEWWVLAGLTKPQATLRLVFGVPRRVWLRAAVLTGVILVVSLLWFGNWPLEVVRVPGEIMRSTRNLWLGLWPFQVPVGVALILFGIRRRDTRLLVAASPFLVPYAAMSSLLGVWLALASYLKDWEAALVWGCWWGAVLYRYFVP